MNSQPSLPRSHQPRDREQVHLLHTYCNNAHPNNPCSVGLDAGVTVGLLQRQLLPPQAGQSPCDVKPTHLGTVSLGIFVYLSHGNVGVEFISVFLYKDRKERREY